MSNLDNTASPDADDIKVGAHDTTDAPPSDQANDDLENVIGGIVGSPPPPPPPDPEVSPISN